ncbi:MAG: T9SS type A sorting domain-containing protein [Bacteroidetes bacterium]|nr:T9SS type A sorting domain-containing protein [Bacteroidota bacterium]
MKKFQVFTLILVLTGMVLSAQDYRNIITNGTAFYSGTSNEPGFLSGIRAETKTSLGNGDTLFLVSNTIRQYATNLPLDTVGGIFGRTVIKKSNGWFWFFNAAGDTMFLNSGAALNDSWKFCDLPLKGRIQATCTSIQMMPLPGTTDMVKEITLQARDSNGVNISNYYNDSSIQVSRLYGFTKVFDLYHFPDTTAVYKIEGKNDPPVGFHGMTWHDLYDFEVGDEFHVVGHTNYLWGNHPATKDYKIIRKVLTKQVSAAQDNVTYTFEYCKEETDFNPILGPSTSYSHDTTTQSYPYSSSLSGSSVDWLPEQFIHSDYRYFSTLQHRVPGRPAYGYSGNYYNCCWGVNPYFNMYIKDDREYTKGLGQVHFKNCWRYIDLVRYDNEDMVYYQKGNETWGSPVAANCSVMAPFLTVSTDTLFLDYLAGSSGTFDISSNKSWTITNAYGDTRFGFAPASGNGGATVTVVASTEDTNYYANNCMLYIACSGGNKTVIISQLPNPVVTISSNPDTLVLGWEYDNWDTLFIHSNTSWNLMSPEPGYPAWLNWSNVSGGGNGIIRFHSEDQNLGTVSRSWPFVLESPAGNREIVVVQRGKSEGVGTNSPVRISLSPNPVQTSATLGFSGLAKNQVKQLALYDFTGRLVFKDSFQPDIYRFDRATLSPGIYILKVSCKKDEPPVVIKMILE